MDFQVTALLLPAAQPAAGEFGRALKGGLAQCRGCARQAGDPARREGGVSHAQAQLPLAPAAGHVPGQRRLGARYAHSKFTLRRLADRLERQFSLQLRVIGVDGQTVERQRGRSPQSLGLNGL